MRPTYELRERPPFACTASVIFFHAATCSALSIAGVRAHPRPIAHGRDAFGDDQAR
jgi:hypothetical protein